MNGPDDDLIRSVKELAYCAGYIDADGSIFITRQRRKNRYQFAPVVQAASANLAVLEHLRRVLGGSVCDFNPKSGAKRQYRMWMWTVTGQAAVYVAKLLLPYLQIKREQAKCLAQFPYGAGRGRRLPDEIQRERQRLYDLCRLQTRINNYTQRKEKRQP